jgi:hypothetical protein
VAISQLIVSVGTIESTSQLINTMGILKALGFALLIITLKFLVPKIFTGLENTLLAFFDVLQTIFATSKSSMTAGFIPSFPVMPTR